MAVCSTTALRKYLTQRSNLGQPLREKAVSTTRGHAEGETLITSGAYRRPLFKSSHTSLLQGRLSSGAVPSREPAEGECVPVELAGQALCAIAQRGGAVRLGLSPRSRR